MSNSITDRAAFFSSYSGRCYLLHFFDLQTGQSAKYGRSGHYLGSSLDIAARLARHRAGNGARLIEVITDAGLSFIVVRTWVGGKVKERQLKSRKNAPRELCPICMGKVSLADVLAEQVPPSPRVVGRRKPMGPDRPVHFARESAPVNDCAWCWRDEHPGQEWPRDRSANICRRHADEEYASYRAGK